jgi:hypothetical protein
MSILDNQIQSISPTELERYRDADWALHDPQVQHEYQGQWVVAYQRRIIAHGENPQHVVADANQLVKDPAHRAVFCAPEDPMSWLENSSGGDVDLANG